MHYNIAPTAIIILGAPGSGKSTATKEYTNRGFHLLESSDELRRMMRDNAHFRVQNSHETMGTGELYSDESVKWAFEDALSNLPKGSNIVMSGYMRRRQQVVDVLEILHSNDYRIVVLYFECRFETCVRRIASRVQEIKEHNAIAGHHDQKAIREDDQGVVEVVKRIDGFEKHIFEVLNQIGGLKQTVITIDANRDKTNVLNQMNKLLNLREFVAI